MSEASTTMRLAGAFAELLEPLAEAARLEPRPYGLLLWLEDHAIDLERHDVDPDGLVPIVTDFVASADVIDALLGGGELPAPGDVPALIDAIAGFVLSLEALAGVELGDEADFDPGALARLTLDALVTDYLEIHHADLFHLLRLLDVARAADPHFGLHARLTPERVRDWIERPGPTARAVYGWGGERFDSDDLLERLAPVLRSMGLPATLEESPLDLRRALTGDGDDAPLPPAAWQLQVPLMNLGDGTGDGDARAELGLRLVPLTATAPGANDAGLALVPYGHGGGYASHTVADDTTVRFESVGDASVPFGLLMRPGDVSLAGLDGANTPVGLDLVFDITRGRPAGRPATLFSAADVATLEIDTVGLALALKRTPDGDADASIALPIRGRLELKPPAGDGFLAAILPPGGIKAPIALDVGWTHAGGFFVGARGALEATVPVERSLLDAVTLHSVTAGLGVDGDRLALSMAVTGSARLGPFRATVDKLGFEVGLTLGDSTGTDAVALDYRPLPPAGIGLSLDSSAITGGGFLAFDAERGRYAGLVHLKHRQLALTGVGILDTRRADGGEGFSLVLVINGELPPVQLGFGFTLNGLGGLLGVNRAANVPALLEGARAGALDAVLFPEDPLANAPRLVRDLGTFFPEREGSYLFGPMARIGWGTVPILDIALGLALELPDPVRLLMFGRLRLGLPSLEQAIARINMDVFGAIDFDAGTLAVDAALVDSSIAGYRLDGQAALRARWGGASPDFALAVGGFHPRATPPAGFPALNRVGIDLSASPDARVRFEGYFALTSNSVQCGARVDAFARAGRVSAEAFLAFDTLFRFDPFRFVVDLAAAATIRLFGKPRLALDLALRLSGPEPWQASGKVRFRLLFIRYTVRFDLSIGRAPDTTPVEVADLRALLLEELARPTAWSGAAPPAEGSAVTLREAALDGETELLVHPQGRFAVRQGVLPLGETVTRHGERPVRPDERAFRIARVHVGEPGHEHEIEHVVLHDAWAPAQHFDRDDTQRLTDPAYVRYPAGIAAAPERAAAGERVSVRPGYEEVVIDVARGERRPSEQRVQLASGTLESLDAEGAAATRARQRRDGLAYPGPKRRARLVPLDRLAS